MKLKLPVHPATRDKSSPASFRLHAHLRRTELSADRKTLTIRIPLALAQRGGRMLVISPNGRRTDLSQQTAPARIDNTIVKALARAFRWRNLLETAAHATIDELARAEKINPSYVSRILRLTLLSPTIIEQIVEGRLPATLQLDDLLVGFPVEWDRQVLKLQNLEQSNG